MLLFYNQLETHECGKGIILQFILHEVFWLDIQDEGFTNFLTPTWFGWFSFKAWFWDLIPVVYEYSNINFFLQTPQHHKKNKLNSKTPIL